MPMYELNTSPGQEVQMTEAEAVELRRQGFSVTQLGPDPREVTYRREEPHVPTQWRGQDPNGGDWFEQHSTPAQETPADEPQENPAPAPRTRRDRAAKRVPAEASAPTAPMKEGS